MSAPDLTIHRLSASTPVAGAHVARLLRGVAEHRFDHALDAAALPPGTWCIRRLDVAVRLDLARPDGALETAWAQALVAALRRALAGGCPDVVHYLRDLDAVTDLICGAATGRTERAWAWRRVGLLGPSDPARDPAGVILAVLRRYPQHAVAAITTAVGRVGLPPLHRVLGPTGWAAVAGTAIAAAAGSAAPQPGEPERADRELAAALLGPSTLAGTIGRSRLRPDPGTVAAWAVLVVAEVDSSVLRRAAAAGRVLAAVAELVWPAGSRPAAARLRPVEQRPAAGPIEERTADERRTDDRVVEDGVAAARATVPPTPAELVPGADLAAERTGRPTAWGGLLFLLATAADAGVPDTVVDDPAFATRPLPWVLQGIAVSLGLPVADPAVAAFAGVDPDERQPWQAGRTATAMEIKRLAAIARRWASVTATALGADDRDPVEVITAMARRRGRIGYTPGWIEAELSLDEVDVGVRRAGLDLDPGWVPWLGAVVRYRYV